MIQLLEQAFEKASKLPEEEQHRVAQSLLAELDDLRWEELFSRPESEVFLGRMADKAWAEHEAGRTVEYEAGRTRFLKSKDL